MSLVPPELLAQLPPFYRTESTEADAKVAVLKIMDPCGRFTLYAVEYEPEERCFFGYVVSPLGPDCDEWGYSSLDELESVRNRLGLPLELDLYWKPGPIPKEVLP